IQETIRSFGKRDSFLSVVDLPDIFEKLSGKLPDKDFFLDYCHHTVKGIQVSMASAAKEILAFYDEDIPIESTLEQATSCVPTKKVEAMAYVFAAIHNAHYGQ